MVIFCEATKTDLPIIIGLLSDDPLGALREETSSVVQYREAFEQILSNANSKLIVGKLDDRVIAVAQIDFIRYLTYQGGKRAQIEGVRVDKNYRGQGIGHQLFNYLIEIAKNEGCHMVQLTTNKNRSEAVCFYKQLNFENTHHGFKLFIED